ncbi:MAG: O-antigen ligase family protein [Patescibacteria group bacterium]|jgi:O-antigen ligase
MASMFLIGLAAILFFFLAYFRPLWAAYLITALLPTYVVRFQIFTIPFTWLEAMVLILFIVVLLKRNFHWSVIKSDPLFYPALAVLIAVTIAVFVSPLPLKALGAWKAYFAEPIMFYFILISLVDVRRQIEGVFWSLGLSVLYMGLICYAQKLTGWGVPQAFLTATGSVDRVVGTYGYPNALGLFFGPIIIAFVGFLFYRNQDSLLLYLSNRQRQWLKWLVIIVGFSVIVLAQSEGAILAVLAVSFLLLLFNRRSRGYALIFLVFSATIVLLNSGWRDLIWQKVSLQDYSGFIRRLIWGETRQMLKDHWFFGGGLAGYPASILPYHTHWFEVFPYPHNILFNFWSEVGVLGIGAFLWLAGKFVYDNLKNIFSIVWRYSQEWPFDKIASVVFMAVALEIVIHGLVDVPYFKNDLSLLVWILLAVSTLNIRYKK